MTTEVQPIILKRIFQTESDLTFQIISSPRSVGRFFVHNGFELSSCSLPELCSTLLYVWGDHLNADNTQLRIPWSNSKYIKQMLDCILAYNMSIGYVDRGWLDDFTSKCTVCGDTVATGMQWCIKCVPENYRCYSCGSDTDLRPWGDLWVCSDCCTHATCNCCGNTTAVLSLIKELPDNYHSKQIRFNYCFDCKDKIKKLVFHAERRYDYIPASFYFWDLDIKGVRFSKPEPTKHKLYMGVEIESQFKPYRHVNEAIGAILKVYGAKKETLVYAKHDGSISDPGSEIVTHPMTLKMIKSLSWKGLYDNVVKPTSTDFGGHIHISKTAFLSIGHTYKFIHFLRTNLEYVTWLGERTFTQYCKAKQDDGSTISNVKKIKRHTNSDRYEMINYTDHTIELRFFLTPWNVNMLYKNTEFVHALWTFTQTCSLNFTMQDFELWVETKSIHYPFLFNYIKGRSTLNPFSTNKETNYKSAYNNYDDCEEESCCYHCDEAYSNDELTTVYNGTTVCNYCLEMYYVNCDHCGTLVYSDNRRTTRDGDFVFCSTCIDRNRTDYAYCPTCNDLEILNENGVCDSCQDDIDESERLREEEEEEERLREEEEDCCSCSVPCAPCSCVD